jgi:vanillate O-demethylase monooxygenase subunit
MFVRNCWYAAAWDHELKPGELISRTILGEPIAVYRAGDGGLVAMEDRCCHRFAPLSKGRLEGDDVRCMYHGLKFDRTGQCIEIPGQDMIPRTARVKAYPAVEKHSWIWVWMGDPAKADQGLIPPAVGFEDPGWTLRSGHMDYEANYLLINDNLTDFTHLSYVHRNSFGATEAFARTRPTVERLERGVRIWRWLSNEVLTSADVGPMQMRAAIERLVKAESSGGAASAA